MAACYMNKLLGLGLLLNIYNKVQLGLTRFFFKVYVCEIIHTFAFMDSVLRFDQYKMKQTTFFTLGSKILLLCFVLLGTL